MAITYYAIKLRCGLVCHFRCTTDTERNRILEQLKATNHELLNTITVFR